MISDARFKEMAEDENGQPVSVGGWNLADESVQALRNLILFTDSNGNRCFCDQWKDPQGLQHSGACLDAQEVLRRADSICVGSKLREGCDAVRHGMGYKMCPACCPTLPHNFDATGAEESNEPLICALCGLDIKNEIHKARAVLSIDGSHACALLGENIQDGEVEFVEIVYPDGKNASDAYKHEKAAAFRALYKLRERLGIDITSALGKGL